MEITKKVLSIMNLLAQGPTGVIEISKQLGIGKSTVSRTLSALENEQWVVQDINTKKYKVSFKMIQLSLSILSRINLRNISLPYMNELRRLTGETVILNLRVDLERVCIEQIQSFQALRGAVELGQMMPLWAGATGKAMLAYLEPHEIETVLNRMEEAGVHVLPSGKTIDAEKIREALSAIRHQGFEVASEETAIGAASVAVPIFNHEDSVVGAISIIGPLLRFTPEVALGHGKLAMQIANKISLELGSSRKY